MYVRLPSHASMNWSVVTSSRTATVADVMRYSRRMRAATSCVTPFVCGHSHWKSTPPRSFFFILMQGGFSLRRMPKLSSSRSIKNLCVTGLPASNTIMIKSHVRAAAMTWRPRPLPVAAPSMIPGKSRIWIRAPRYFIVPGIAVSVVNSYAAASDLVPVKVVNSVDLPTEGKPTRPTRVSPTFLTSKPRSPPPPLLLVPCSSSSRRSFASLALIKPRWPSVCLFFWVRAYSYSSSLIFSSVVGMVAPSAECSEAPSAADRRRANRFRRTAARVLAHASNLLH
mmetsp:Transcript_13993/g.41798  ORF Transcript_13993/g.41798 Transcript_13993/m.41798 type:complete len:282 (-) Transcript_13993:151-996(-)